VCVLQEEIVAKFVWLGQRMGLVSKPKDVDDDVDLTGGGQHPNVPAAGPSQPPVAAAAFPPARPVGSFNPAAAKPTMPAYAGGMHPRYGGLGSGTGATKATGLKPGEDSPLTKRAAAVIAAASSNNH